MNLERREFLKTGVSLVVGFSLNGVAEAQQLPAAMADSGRPLDPNDVDAFLGVAKDGRVTIYCGKVDLGQGLRIAIPQMAAEELGCRVESITLVEGDTALTPDQGPTAGSTGVMRGGVQIRQAAATAREALIGFGAERLARPRAELELVDGVVECSWVGELDEGETPAAARVAIENDANTVDRADGFERRA